MRQSGEQEGRVPGTETVMPGSIECCPKCGSRNVGFDPKLAFKGYGPGLAACADCSCLWEPYRLQDLLDADDPLSSFTEPCSNCAFRPGSPEQKKGVWADLLQQLRDGGAFYCHKGVPIESDAEHGFAYPYREVVIDVLGVVKTIRLPDKAKLRLCRGYLRAFAMWARP